MHMPGEWVAKQEFANRWAIEVPKDGFVPTTIAHVSTANLGMGGSNEFTEGNAKLIAAAPNLLDACRQAQEWLEGWASAGEQLRIIRAAIAKATNHDR